MAKETSKAMRRRDAEEKAGGFKWSKVFKGRGADIGAGDDPLPFPDCKPFDMQDGDANLLQNYFPAENLDYLHASQCLEHMRDVRQALKNWLSVVKKGGYIVATFPCMELYGDILWGKNGSRYNPDHKATFSYGLKRSGCRQHIYMPDFEKEIKSWGHKVVIGRVVDDNYDYSIGFTTDQTWVYENFVECWIELVLMKGKK